MVWLNRSERVAESTKRIANLALAIVLTASVVLDPFVFWHYNRHDPTLAWKQIISVGLPFYLCDIVALVLAWALWRRSPRCAELGYLWGIAGTVQGLITPTLYYDWDSIAYYVFFAQHSGVPIAALTVAYGLRLQPQRGALVRTVAWSFGYMVGAFGLNSLLGSNYGFVNGKPNVPTMFDHMGPYPWYLLTLQAIAATVYALLLIPFIKNWKKPVNPMGPEN
jgi:hypothetical integral membrane protein (TIGR02206 family)